MQPVVDDRGGDFIPQFENIDSRALEVVLPQRHTARTVDQLGGDQQLAGVYFHFAGHDLLDAELTADLARIGRGSNEVRHQAQRFDGERQVLDASDETLREAEAQVVDGVILRGVDERKHRKRRERPERPRGHARQREDPRGPE